LLASTGCVAIPCGYNSKKSGDHGTTQ